MNRRGFLGAILAAAAAPAIVRADSLMRIVPRDAGLWRPTGMEVIPPLRGELGQIDGVKIISTSEAGPLTLAHVRRIVDVMRERELKPDRHGNYIMYLPSSDGLAMLKALR